MSEELVRFYQIAKQTPEAFRSGESDVKPTWSGWTDPGGSSLPRCGKNLRFVSARNELLRALLRDSADPAKDGEQRVGMAGIGPSCCFDQRRQSLTSELPQKGRIALPRELIEQEAALVAIRPQPRIQQIHDGRRRHLDVVRRFR